MSARNHFPLIGRQIHRLCPPGASPPAPSRRVTLKVTEAAEIQGVRGGLLKRFEDSLDRMVNGAFTGAFTAEVQPVKIAAALQRDIDDHALQSELADLVKAYGAEQQYTLLGSVTVTISTDEDLETGIFLVRSEARGEVSAKQVSNNTPVADQPRLILGDTAYPLVRAMAMSGSSTGSSGGQSERWICDVRSSS